MATATASIYIDGEKLLPYHVQVEQSSDWHHQFEITIATEKAKVMDSPNAPESATIDNAIAYAGAVAEITIERHNGTFTFKGYITDVHIDQTYAGDSFIILKGYAPTYLLEGQQSVASFEEKSLKDIFNEVLSDFPSNVSREVNPKFSSPIPYVVRYKETQYQFLSRLAATYGEWFYYDGQKIVFGDLPSKNPEVKLTFGSDSMLSFNYSINLRPSSFKQQFYKYQDNGTLEQSGTSVKPGWLDPHSKKSLSASENLFVEEGLQPVAFGIKDDKHLKHITEAKKSSTVGDVMLFTGQSANPGLSIGTEVEVSSQKGFIGKYRIISVTHSFDSNRDYINAFVAIPVSTVYPPINKKIRYPLAEAQAGEVTDNNDPDKLGRVRVKLKWQEGTTPWVRVITNYAGPGASEGVTGTYFVPEIGDEVFVEFEQGDPDRPYVVGSNYHGSIAPDFANPDNNLKAIKTRSGHILKFDDTDGDEKILITDKKGNLLEIETKGDKITINAGDSIIINAGTSIALKAGSSISIEAGQTISLMSGASVTVASPSIGLVGGGVSVNAASSYVLTTTNKSENVSANSLLRTKNLTNYVSENMSLTANIINQTAKKDINSKAKKNILISADSKLEQRGGTVDMSAKKGKVRIKASGNTELKGKLVKSN